MRTRTAALGPFEDVAAVADHRVPVTGGEITVRVYSPGGLGPHPVLVFYHGGGWVIGDLDTHDGICRSLANAAGCAVARVDYRLAPEFKYPDAGRGLLRRAPAGSSRNATRLGIDPARVAVGGDSAGGNLAAVVALMARDRGGPRLLLQLLVYPVTDYDFDTRLRTARTPTGYVLDARGHALVLAPLPGARGAGARAARLAAAARTSLAGLPPALVVTAGCDPLRDEGEAYAARLRDAGVRGDAHAVRRACSTASSA